MTQLLIETCRGYMRQAGLSVEWVGAAHAACGLAGAHQWLGERVDTYLAARTDREGRELLDTLRSLVVVYA